ncbi:hypothetical protein Droror1_Dr00020628, partial [Drosera rotundifolia]
LGFGGGVRGLVGEGRCGERLGIEEISGDERRVRWLDGWCFGGGCGLAGERRGGRKGGRSGCVCVWRKGGIEGIKKKRIKEKVACPRGVC